MKKNRLLVLICFIMSTMLLISACSQAKPAAEPEVQPNPEMSLTIGCAAGLTDAMTDIASQYESTHPETKLTLNFASSGTLQQQIEQGADIDVFISASNKQITALKEKDLIVEDSLRVIAANSLVLIAPIDSTLDIKSTADLVNHDNVKIAVGDPGFVPAGKYAEEVFAALNITDSVKDKLVYGKDVREVLAWVESANLDAGFVYQTDALITDKVKIIESIDSSLHSPIVYPTCIVTASKKQEVCSDFITYLSSDESKKILKDYGFLPSK